MENILFGPDGKPMPVGRNNLDGKFVVLHTDKPPDPSVVQAIAQTLNCSVLVIPHHWLLLSGELAWQDIKRIHASIHQTLEHTEPDEKVEK